jgi:uncharacterized protein (TIRG00374 family)
MLANNKPQFKSWVSVSALLGFAALLLYMYFFGNLGQIAGALAKTSLPIYFLAFVCVIGSAVFNSLAWKEILSKLSVKSTFRRVFTLSWVGTFVDAIVPGGWSGDIFKGYLLAKDKGADGAKTAASIIIKNIFELLVTLAALITGTVLLALNYALDSSVIIAIGAMMVLLSLPLIIALYVSLNANRSKRLLGLVHRFMRLIKGKQADTAEADSKLRSTLTDFHDGIMIMKTNAKGMLKPALYQTIAWAFDITVLFLIFASIGYIISPDKIIITNEIVVNLQVQGFAMAGFAQVASSTIYTILGITPLISMTSSLLAAFPTFWFKIAISFVMFQVIVFERAIPFMSSKTAGLKPKPLPRDIVLLAPEET